MSKLTCYRCQRWTTDCCCTTGALIRPEADVVKEPEHYRQGHIQCWDYIASHKMGFLQGNIIKYVTRYLHKDKPIQDLKKARAYIDKLIEETKKDGLQD